MKSLSLRRQIKMLIIIAALACITAIVMAENLPAAPAPVGSSRPNRTLQSDVYGRSTLNLVADTLCPKSYRSSAPLASHVLPATLGGRESDTTSGLFSPYVSFPVGGEADALTIGDVTGDGLNDVVLVDPGHDSLYVFVQSDSGTFKPHISYVAKVTYIGLFTGSVAIADFNNDSRLDVVFTSDDAIGVMLQNAEGTLDSPNYYPSAHQSFSNIYKLRVGDFNNDKLSDVVAIDWGTQSQAVEIFLQKPGGGFWPPQTYTVIHEGYDDLAVGDVNNDKLDDIVVMSGQGFSDNIGILIQSESGSFDGPYYYDLGGDELTQGVEVGDVNGDGRNDVVISYGGNSPWAFIAVFLQNESGTLDTAISMSSYDCPQPVEVGDINMDGRTDVLVAHGGWEQLGVYLQNRDGSLAPEELYPITYASHYNRHAMAIGDLNDDHKPDVAIADYGAGLVVLYNSYYRCGDADGSGQVGLPDVVYLVNYIFVGGTAPDPVLSGDANGDGRINIADVVFLINCIFRDGPAPCSTLLGG
jgi:hypothetical protein